MPTGAAVFGLDGALVTTGEMRYRAWLRVAREEGIPFDWKINDRMHGISREASPADLLECAARPYARRGRPPWRSARIAINWNSWSR